MPVRPLRLELSEAVFDRPIGLAQLIEAGDPALADRFVLGAEFIDFLSQLSKLAMEVLFALGQLGEKAFDRSAGRGLHGLFEGDCGWPVEPAKKV